jgi:hypothetical protein
MWYFYKNNVLDFHPSTSLDIQPKNMDVFCGMWASESFLQHGHFRWIKKSPVSIVSDELNRCLKKDIKVYANGVQARREKA